MNLGNKIAKLRKDSNLSQEDLAEKVAKKKFDLKFRKLLTLLNVIFESDDDTGTAYQEGLNEVSKLRMELINKYRKHLEKEEADLMNKKLDILEQ